VYVTELYVDRLKLLHEFTLKLVDPDGEPRMWTVLVGENGRCKTSVLKAIALAASGGARANELAELAALPDRRATEPVTVRGTFALPKHPKRNYPGWPDERPAPTHLKSELTMPAGLTSMRGSSGYVGKDGIDLTIAGEGGAIGDPLFEIRGADLPVWFVAGYGTTRVLPTPGSVEAPTNASVARIRNLFDQGQLIGTGFADLLEDSKHFSALLRDALIGGGILPEEATGLELRGRGGIRNSKDLVEGSRFTIRSGGEDMKIPATWLSQGFQSTIAWIADLLGHIVLETQTETAPVPLAEIQGLVLIDEIDLHLHPRWQVRLVAALKRVFPKVQFVVTTHSPMVLPALRQEEIVILDVDGDGDIVAHAPDSSPMLLTGSEIYQEFFGIDELHPADLAHDRRRYGFLVGNPMRTDDEEREMQQIRAKFQELGIDPGWEPVPRSAE